MPSFSHKVNQRNFQFDDFLYSLVILIWGIYITISLKEFTLQDFDLGARRFLFVGFFFTCFYLIYSRGKTIIPPILSVYKIFAFIVVVVILVNANFYHSFNYYSYCILKHLYNITLLYTTYIYIKNNGIKNIIWIFYIFIYICLLLTYLKNMNIALSYAYVQLTSVYFILLYIPILLLHPSKLLRNIILCISAVVLISSFKRGAFIAFILSTLCYYLANLYSETRKNNSKRTRSIIVSVVFGAVLGLFVYSFLQSNQNPLIERIQNIGEDGGSGRDYIWEFTWQMICQSEFVSLVFGHGEDAVRNDSILAISSHNDFLEIIYNYGLFAFLFYLLFVFKWIKKNVWLIKNKDSIGSVMLFLSVSVLCMSLVSHVVTYSWMILVCHNLGVIYGLINRNNYLK